MARRKGRDGNWRVLALIGALAAMVLVMAVTAFTLHKSSPLIARLVPRSPRTSPPVQAKPVVVPLRGQPGSERSVEGSPEPRARERSFVPLSPGELRGSSAP
jgi:hypothetical protein